MNNSRYTIIHAFNFLMENVNKCRMVVVNVCFYKSYLKKSEKSYQKNNKLSKAAKSCHKVAKKFVINGHFLVLVNTTLY